MVNTIFNYTDIEKCKMQLQLNILIGEKNPELNWLTRPVPFQDFHDPTRPDPRMDPTRDQLCVSHLKPTVAPLRVHLLARPARCKLKGTTLK
jgi:hypothetical protein